MRLFDEQYLKTPFYGIRRMTDGSIRKGSRLIAKESSDL